MPEAGTVALFALAAVALIAIPGPNAIYIAARSLSQGRAAGVASALGVEAGTLVHIGAAVAGLSAIIASSDFLAFLPQFTDPERGPVASQTLVLGVVFFAIALAMDLIYALTASGLRARLSASDTAARRRERLSGAVYVALAVFAAVAGKR
jgi:threonine/homoserine/homoserine lactone efflux protein